MELALSNVDADARFEVERADAVDDRLRCADRACWTIEGREEPVADSVTFLSAEVAELTSDDRVVASQQVAPGAIADPRGVVGRADDVGEHDGREHAFRDGRSFFPGDEPLDLVDDVECLLVAEVVVARDAHDPRIGDTRRHVHRLVRRRRVHRLRQGAVEKQSGDAHSRQHIAQVGLDKRTVERVSDSWTHRDTQRICEPAAMLLAPSQGRGKLLEQPVTPLLGTPTLPKSCQLLPSGFRFQPWALRHGVKEHERARPLRIRRGEHDGHPAPLVLAEDHRTRRPCGIENGVQVLHPRLQRRELASMIGDPGSALVEQDQTERTSQAEEEVALIRILPVKDEIRAEAGNVDKVDVPFADHLVGNRDSTVSRVLDLSVGRGLDVLLHRDILTIRRRRARRMLQSAHGLMTKGSR